jgi:hypothetical protein
MSPDIGVTFERLKMEVLIYFTIGLAYMALGLTHLLH